MISILTVCWFLTVDDFCQLTFYLLDKGTSLTFMQSYFCTPCLNICLRSKCVKCLMRSYEVLSACLHDMRRDQSVFAVTRSFFRDLCYLLLHAYMVTSYLQHSLTNHFFARLQFCCEKNIKAFTCIGRVTWKRTCTKTCSNPLSDSVATLWFLHVTYEHVSFLFHVLCYMYIWVYPFYLISHVSSILYWIL